MPVNPEDYNSDAISGEKLLALMQDEVYDRLKGDVPESLAVFLCSLKAQVDSIQKVISEKNLGECVADSIDAQNLSVKGEKLGTAALKDAVTSWQSVPDNNHVPTENLVKSSLDQKENLLGLDRSSAVIGKVLDQNGSWVSTGDFTPSFSEDATKSTIAQDFSSGSKLSSLLAKIRAWFGSLGNLAFKNSVNWLTEITNKPSIGSGNIYVNQTSGNTETFYQFSLNQSSNTTIDLVDTVAKFIDRSLTEYSGEAIFSYDLTPNVHARFKAQGDSNSSLLGSLVPIANSGNVGQVLTCLNAAGNIGFEDVHAGVLLTVSGSTINLVDGSNNILSSVEVQATGGLTYKGYLNMDPQLTNPDYPISTPAAVRGDMYICNKSGVVNDRFNVQAGTIFICKVASTPYAYDPIDGFHDYNIDHANDWDCIVVNATPFGNVVLGPATSVQNAVALFDGTTGNLLKNGPGYNPTTGVLSATATVAQGYSSGGGIDSALSGKASSTHTHGSINNNGTANGSVSVANGDSLMVADASDSSRIRKSGIQFDGTTTTSFLSRKGTWETTISYATSASNYSSGGTIESALNSKESSFSLGDGLQWNPRILNKELELSSYSAYKQYTFYNSTAQTFLFNNNTTNGIVGAKKKIVINSSGNSVYTKCHVVADSQIDAEMSASRWVEITFDVIGEYSSWYDSNRIVTIEPVVELMASGNVYYVYDGTEFLDSCAGRYNIVRYQGPALKGNDSFYGGFSVDDQSNGQAKVPFNIRCSVTLPAAFVVAKMRAAVPDQQGYASNRTISFCIKSTGSSQSGTQNSVQSVTIRAVWAGVRLFK